MKYLLQGHESAERMEIIFSFTKMDSEPMKAAIIDHLVNGHPKEFAAKTHLVLQPNFSRAMDKLNVIAGKIERIKELDWAKFKSDKWY